MWYEYMGYNECNINDIEVSTGKEETWAKSISWRKSNGQYSKYMTNYIENVKPLTKPYIFMVPIAYISKVS